MAKVSGFVTRVEAGRPKPSAKRMVDQPAEVLRTMGLRGVRGMNPDAKHPNLEPSGPKNARLYVLSEHPGTEEDRSGNPWSGNSGRHLATLLDRQDVRLNYTVRTMPPKGRAPKPFEVECFRESVEEDIVGTKPTVILALGLAATRWLVPAVSNMTSSRGRTFPTRVGKLTCLVVPTLHPAAVLRELDSGSPRGESLAAVLGRDVALAQELASGGASRPKIPGTKAAMTKGCETYAPGPGAATKLFRALDTLLDEPGPIACDVETTALRPYGKGAAIISIAFSSRTRHVAFPYEHPDHGWTAPQRKKLTQHVRRLLTSGRPMIFHNLQFDLEWFCSQLGADLAWAGNWQDTQAQAFVLDERQNALSLDFLCRQHFGIDLKAFSNLDRKRLVEAPLAELLLYNAMDTKWTRRLYIAQAKLLEAQGLKRVYRDQVLRVPMLTLAQLEGVPVHQGVVEELRSEYQDTIEALGKDLRQLPAVRKYEKRYGPLNPNSTKQVATLVIEFLGKGDQVTKAGKVSVDEAALSAIGGQVCDTILALRKAEKVLGTYISPLLPGHPGTVLHDDGRIHTNFNATVTATRRLSSNAPNVQNFPKRNPVTKRIRKAVTAPPGMVVVSADYGQIEWRVIGMASQDPYIIDALWNQTDVHMEWAEKLTQLNPDVCRSRYGDLSPASMKKLRSDVKNEFVFPLCFGAKCGYVARMCDTPERKFRRLYDEFWDRLPRVLQWQSGLQRSYARLGYVETLTGYRRRAPMSPNKIINSPVQGTASDITVNAMVRLSKLAGVLGMPHLQPVLNIHDDITFIVPKKSLDAYVKEIAKAMVSPPFDWINCPVVAEVEAGPDWFNLSHVGDFSSVDILGHQRGNPIPKSAAPA